MHNPDIISRIVMSDCVYVCGGAGGGVQGYIWILSGEREQIFHQILKGALVQKTVENH